MNSGESKQWIRKDSGDMNLLSFLFVFAFRVFDGGLDDL